MTPPSLPPSLQQSAPVPGQPQVFSTPTTATTKAFWLTLAAIGLVMVALLGFFLNLISPKSNMIQMQMTCTIPLMGAFFCAMAAYTIARSPRQVVVDDAGVTVASGKSERRFAWDQIAWSETVTQGLNARKSLRLYGNDGKTLATLSGELFAFDWLVQLVQHRLAANPSPHTSIVRWRKSKRRGALLITGGLMFCALAIAVGGMAWYEHHSEALLNSNGVDGEGIVENKLIAPDGRTHRVEYRVTSGSKSDVRNVQVEVPLWETLKKGDRLPIRTVPDHPDISRLMFGEVKDDFNPSPAMSMGLSVLVFIMSMVFLVVGIMGRRGIDLKFDSNTRKFRVERLGTSPTS